MLAAAVGFLAMRHIRRPEKVTVKAGEGVISTRGGRRVQSAPRPDAPPRFEGQPEPPRREPRFKGRQEKAQPAPPAVADPQLTGPVVLEAAWSQSVFHGARDDGAGFKVAVRVATARGRSHAYNGEPGQDAAGVVWCEHRRSIFLVVADGLGSKPDSGLVAHGLVEEVIGRAAELQVSESPTGMLASVVTATEHWVRQKRLDGASTLAVAEVRLGRDGHEVLTWGIGDSEAWVLADGAWEPLHHERRADAENITRHLPGHHDMHRSRRQLRRNSVITVASDGFASALAKDSPLARELADQWRKPPAALDFLSRVNFEDPYFNDDRAAVAVWIR
ncbi:protein phosphatase 2C domain-containing protein [Dactylosporangium vinaceum]|uniref:Protein phosphatase 2C domain-containing protein n=2 Tax=Dactylosporangium vinaceum TaxID=53362 RepID=A0ABV5MIH4_9ACTN